MTIDTDNRNKDEMLAYQEDRIKALANENRRLNRSVILYAMQCDGYKAQIARLEEQLRDLRVLNGVK